MRNRIKQYFATEPVKQYITAEKKVFSYFGCKADYFIKPLEDYKWMIKEDSGVTILTYWSSASKPISSVIVKKDGKPLVYKSADYTMIIGIDCVKIAFVLKNTNFAEA